MDNPVNAEMRPLLSPTTPPTKPPTDQSAPSPSPSACEPSTSPYAPPSTLTRLSHIFSSPYIPPGISPRPKYLPNGTRVFLHDQRGPTRSELGWTLLTLPVYLIRNARLPTDEIERLERAGELRDPTVIVPTVPLAITDELVDEPDPVLLHERLTTLRERRDRLAVENDTWSKLNLSRRERLKRINPGMLWTKDGQPVPLLARRENTWPESILTFLTCPLLFWRSWWGYWGAMRRMMKEGGEWDAADVPDPTVVVPTGKSWFLEEELLAVRPEKKVET